MLVVRPLSVPEFLPAPEPPLACGPVLPLPDGHALRHREARLWLVRPDTTEVDLGVEVLGHTLSYVIDAWRPTSLVLCDTMRVWRINWAHGLAELLVQSGGTPWGTALPLPDGALLTLDHSPHDVLTRWEPQDGSWTRTWSTELPRNNEKISTVAHGRILLIHRKHDDLRTWFCSLSTDGLRPLCGITERTVATMDHEGMALVDVDLAMRWWHALEGVEAACARVSNDPPLGSLRDIELEEATILGDEEDEDYEDEEA